MATEAQPAAVAAPAAAAPAAAAPAAPAPAAAAPAAAAPAAAAPALVVVDSKAAREWLKTNVDDPDNKLAGKSDAEVVELHRVGQAALAKAPKPDVVPDKYEDFKAPAGVTIEKSVGDTVKAAAKKAGMTQAKAQEFIDSVAPAIAKGDSARLEAFATQRADKWRADALADPEFGGVNVEANRAIAMKTFDAFGTPALKEVLNKTGFGDNPEILRWAYRVGKLIGPDGKFVTGAAAPALGANASLEDRATSKLWPDKK